MLFVCVCLSYATLKIWRRSAVQGRISLALTADSADAVGNPAVQRRGWWDHVPNANASLPPARESPVGSRSISIAERIHSSLVQLSGSQSDIIVRKPSLTSTNNPLPQGRQHYVSLSEKDSADATRGPTFADGSGGRPLALSTVANNLPGLSLPQKRQYERVPRILLLQSVLRNELYYASGTLVSFAVVGLVLFLAPPSFDSLLGPITWLGFSWVVTTCLVLCSFGTVIARQERDAAQRAPMYEPMTHLGGGPAPQPRHGPISTQISWEDYDLIDEEVGGRSSWCPSDPFDDSEEQYPEIWMRRNSGPPSPPLPLRGSTSIRHQATSSATSIPNVASLTRHIWPASANLSPTNSLLQPPPRPPPPPWKLADDEVPPESPVSSARSPIGYDLGTTMLVPDRLMGRRAPRIPPKPPSVPL